MTENGKFEAILIGPDGMALQGQQSLMAGEIPNEIEILRKEGPFPLILLYARTSHKIEGRVRFDWVQSAHIDNVTIYRLASTDGLGSHGLNNDPE